ncbi:hypothetical protein ACNVED_06635 [Legionella sp. D16C41]|uniref:hypothetical protein n=1 Tax=Legionella sp. D16C41 TaxID=3402688 RepID=UPI003AF79D8D
MPISDYEPTKEKSFYNKEERNRTRDHFYNQPFQGNQISINHSLTRALYPNYIGPNQSNAIANYTIPAHSQSQWGLTDQMANASFLNSLGAVPSLPRASNTASQIYQIARTIVSNKNVNKKSKRSAAMVDPKTGKPSEASNAIPYGTYRDRRTVDPITGKFSTKKNAISYSTYRFRKLVDPITGKPSSEKNAIPYSTFRSRKQTAYNNALLGITSPNWIITDINAINTKKSKTQEVANTTIISSASTINNLWGEQQIIDDFEWNPFQPSTNTSYLVELSNNESKANDDTYLDALDNNNIVEADMSNDFTSIIASTASTADKSELSLSGLSLAESESTSCQKKADNEASSQTFDELASLFEAEFHEAQLNKVFATTSISSTDTTNNLLAKQQQTVAIDSAALQRPRNLPNYFTELTDGSKSEKDNNTVTKKIASNPTSLKVPAVLTESNSSLVTLGLFSTLSSRSKRKLSSRFDELASSFEEEFKALQK